MSKIKTRIQPLLDKLVGRAPLCPWPAAAAWLHPSTLRAYPPVSEIRTVESKERRKLLEFGGKHRFWFPEGMEESKELWSEYLVGFWDHPVNFHQYLRGGVTLEADDVVVDCGACEGFFTRAALEAGVKKVICVEPSSVMADCLRMTFGTEIAAGRVVVAQVALGSFPGSAGFASAEDDAFAGRFDNSGGETVEVATLDGLAAQYGTPTFIKMDLEGSEYQALAGGAGLLRQHHPKLGITTYHNPWDHAVVSAFLKGLGYSSVKPYGNTYRNEATPRPVMIHAW
jgi:FkbM family methyltransferase